MNEAQKTTDFLFAKMKKLYPTFERPDEIDVSVWVDILDGYSQTDILDALKNYRKTVPYNTAPTPAKFKDYLPEKHVKAETETIKRELPTPESLMALDISTGDCRNNLYVYREAFDICLDKFLREVVPDDVVDHAFWPRNLQLAVENGVFGRFSEAMLMAAQRRFGRDYEFPSENDLEAQKGERSAADVNAASTLASHWRVA